MSNRAAIKFDYYNPATWLVADEEETKANTLLKPRFVQQKIFPDEVEEEEGEEEEVEERGEERGEEGEVAGEERAVIDDDNNEEEDEDENENMRRKKEAHAENRSRFSLNQPMDALLVEAEDSNGEVVQMSLEISAPDPPKEINAVGKDAYATVWWQYDRNGLSELAWITTWEVSRWKHDKEKKEWQFKGTTFITEPHEIDRNRVDVTDLQNDCLYKFAVVGKNVRGKGFQSPFSEVVMVEAALPPGWFRFWDSSSERFYYTNIKTKQSSWTRPEKDAHFLDESIVVLFDEAERKNLQELYDEEIFHFGRVTSEGCKRMFLEAGEVLGIQRVTNYFVEFGNLGLDSISSYKAFMMIAAAIKKKNRRRDTHGSCHKCCSSSCCLVCCCVWNHCACLSWGKKCFRAFFQDNKLLLENSKYGVWHVEWSPEAERNFYRNSKTGDIQWDAPSEVRFFLPPLLEKKMNTLFDPHEIETLRLQFSQLDFTSSGHIDAHGFKLVLESNNIKVTDAKREKMIKSIDENNNGKIEYQEFLSLMISLRQRSGIFADLLGSATDTKISPTSLTAPPAALVALSMDRIASAGAESEAEERGEAYNDKRKKRGCCSFANCLHNTHACVNSVVRVGDSLLDFFFCKRAPGSHGKHCMCGCRKINDWELLYSPFDKKRAEPLECC